MLVELVLLVLCGLIYCIWRDTKPSNMPPGPREVPFLGQVPHDDGEYFMALREHNGDIVTTRTGVIRTVSLFDYKTAKEVLSRPEFSDRPKYFNNFMIDEEKKGGVTFSNGAEWVHDRRFMIRNLRNMGMGKSHLETAINFEAQALVDDLKSYAGKPVDVPNSFRTAPLNVIWQMMAGRRYDLNSTEVEAIYKASRDFLTAGGLFMMLSTWFPVLAYVPLPHFIKRWVDDSELAEQFTKAISEIVIGAVEEHEKSFDPNNMRDLIDEYIRDMRDAEKKGEPHLFRRQALCQIVADGFDAGSDTVNFSMRWVVHILAQFPNVTAQLQQQLDQALPRDQLATSADKPNLPLIESFVNEVFRYSCFVAASFVRVAQRDTTIANYVIPKGTEVRAIIHSMHFDPENFTDPLEFKADRFLDSEGKYQPPKEGFFLFSGGRRACPGETLARSEVFLFTAALAQNFTITVPEGATLLTQPTQHPFGIRLPPEQKLIYTCRS